LQEEGQYQSLCGNFLLNKFTTNGRPGANQIKSNQINQIKSISTHSIQFKSPIQINNQIKSNQIKSTNQPPTKSNSNQIKFKSNQIKSTKSNQPTNKQSNQIKSTNQIKFTTKSNQIKSNQIKSQIKFQIQTNQPNQPNSNQIKSNQTKSNKCNDSFLPRRIRKMRRFAVNASSSLSVHSLRPLMLIVVVRISKQLVFMSVISDRHNPYGMRYVAGMEKPKSQNNRFGFKVLVKPIKLAWLGGLFTIWGLLCEQ
jgi:hypothetical protein